MKKRICCIITIYIFLFFFQLKVFGAEGTILTNTGGDLSTGKYYLNSNINLTNNINVPKDAEVTIDLNGYVLQHSKNARAIVVASGGTLIIKDSNDTKPHYGSLNNNLWVYNSSATSGVEIKGGIITGGTTSDRGRSHI